MRGAIFRLVHVASRGEYGFVGGGKEANDLVVVSLGNLDKREDCVMI